MTDFFNRLTLKNKTFSLVCNNCVGWDIYRRYKLRYSTPTIGLFFWSDDFISFLERFPKVLKEPLTFAESSRHEQVNLWREVDDWPIGRLGEIEIHFSHYNNKPDAISSWYRRLYRFNYDNVFFLMFDKYGFTDEHFKRWQKLPLKNKLLMTSDPKYVGDDVIYMPEFQNSDGWQASWTQKRTYLKYLDVTKWLNGKPNFRRLK
jgi:uncharacterized protein (DUF1919 family)